MNQEEFIEIKGEKYFVEGGKLDLSEAWGYYNKIEQNEIDKLNDLAEFSSLRELDLSRHYYLQELPESITNLSSLRKLDLTSCGLTSLPESIGNLPSLIELNLYNNRLMSLPDSIGTLKSLQKLNIGNNRITCLPDSLGNISALQTLEIGLNALTSLPQSIKDHKNLKEFDYYLVDPCKIVLALVEAHNLYGVRNKRKDKPKFLIWATHKTSWLESKPKVYLNIGISDIIFIKTIVEPYGFVEYEEACLECTKNIDIEALKADLLSNGIKVNQGFTNAVKRWFRGYDYEDI